MYIWNCPKTQYHLVLRQLFPADIYTYLQTFIIAYIFRDFTKALITFPKPVIAVVNGPAVGLGMAMLPLCDIVYASDKATFYLPYSALSQTPEGCASYTLPQSVGMAMVSLWTWKQIKGVYAWIVCIAIIFLNVWTVCKCVVLESSNLAYFYMAL